MQQQNYNRGNFHNNRRGRGRDFNRGNKRGSRSRNQQVRNNWLGNGKGKSSHDVRAISPNSQNVTSEHSANNSIPGSTLVSESLQQPHPGGPSTGFSPESFVPNAFPIFHKSPSGFSGTLSHQSDVSLQSNLVSHQQML